MKKILFIIPSYTMGGTLISLRGLLSSLDTKTTKAYVVDLMPGGMYKDLLPNCSFVKSNVWLSVQSTGLNLPSRFFHKALFAIRKVLMKITRIDVLPLYFKVGCRRLGTNKFDAIVCYSESIAKYVCHYPSKKKYVWIHCDYKRVFQATDMDVYNSFNSIVCVSHFGKRRFDECWPSLSNRTVAIHNIIDYKYVLKQSQCLDSLDRRFDYSDFTIVSIGRLDPIKQFTLIPKMASIIKNNTKKIFKWYIIGGGSDAERVRIENEISINKVYDCVYLLGEKKNVYPYLRLCNLYVNTSKSEAYSLVNNEAKALGIPIISNNFECVEETILDGVDGMITNINDIAFCISDFINGAKSFNVSPIDNSKSINCIKMLFS